MARSLTSLVLVFEKLWPPNLAEQWDSPGLSLGNPQAQITKVLLSVDVTLEVIDEAILNGCQLVLSHHPLLHQAINQLPENSLKGALVAKALQNSIAIYSAHTNADVVESGVSDSLAKAIGIENSSPLSIIQPGVGHGRIGNIAQTTLSELATNLQQILPKTNAPIRVAGDPSRTISRVALVGGAGDSFIEQAIQQGADCLITSDLRHHVTLDAIQDPRSEFSLIDISHFAAESLWLNIAAQNLANQIPDVSFQVSGVNTDPWSMSISGTKS